MEALARGERYVLLSEISEYYKFITDNGTLRRYLFESNVRDFMGLNRVNEDIRQTLESSGSTDFWWLNNGITILATSASVVGKAIQMQDIQIVNGLQTTESIYRFFSNGGQDTAKRSVLVKVIVTKDDAVKDSIIRATNNQTAVELVSLHATDKIQRDIEDVLLRRGLCYDRRTNYYHNLGRSTEEIVSPLYLAAGFVALILKWPSKASRLKSRFMRNPDSYSKVFSPTAPLEIWPKIAKLLKSTDAVLELLRPGGKGGERFLKNWRYMVGLLVVVDSLGRFDFGYEGLLKVPDGAASEAKVKELWLLLNQYLTRLGDQPDLTDRSTTIELCRMYATDRRAQGIEGMANRGWYLRDDNRWESARLTSDVIKRVKEVLPKQPWKPGMHKDIANTLQISTNQYFAAVEALIEEGVFCHQRDGVLYDRDGNVVGFDADRVDPETMMLKDRQED
ncbi:MAG: AIPR family protein [Nitrospira sp.]